MQQDIFEIKLPLFEGPFDLLLFFIERDELDIHDIPISKVTKDFLTYLKQLSAMNIEVASEFILVAATLMQIKAKMLLPRTVKDESGNEIDPREDLIKHLLEYKKYKSVVPELNALEMVRMEKNERGNILEELEDISGKQDVESELQDLNLFRLLKLYQKVLKRYELESTTLKHTIVQYPYSIEQQKDFITELISGNKKLSFSDLLEHGTTKIWIVYNFLAILELLQSGEIKIHIGFGYNNFWVEPIGLNEEINEYVEN